MPASCSLDLAGQRLVLVGELDQRLEVVDVALELLPGLEPARGARVLGADLGGVRPGRPRIRARPCRPRARRRAARAPRGRGSGAGPRAARGSPRRAAASAPMSAGRPSRPKLAQRCCTEARPPRGGRKREPAPRHGFRTWRRIRRPADGVPTCRTGPPAAPGLNIGRGPPGLDPADRRIPAPRRSGSWCARPARVALNAPWDSYAEVTTHPNGRASRCARSSPRSATTPGSRTSRASASTRSTARRCAFAPPSCSRTAAATRSPRSRRRSSPSATR